jgi:hypothetical protein
MRRILKRAAMTAAVGAAAAAVPASAMAAPAQAAAAPVPASAVAAPDTGRPASAPVTVQLPLSGTIQGPSEPIDINGTLNVQVVTPAGPPDGGPVVNVVARLAGTTGTGQTTGNTYRFRGTDTFPQQSPGSGGGVLTFTPVFKVYPPDPAGSGGGVPGPEPVQILQLTVPVAADGTIGDITATLLTPAS